MSQDSPAEGARRRPAALETVLRHDRPLVSFLASFAVHAALIVALGLVWFAQRPGNDDMLVLSSGMSGEEPGPEPGAAPLAPPAPEPGDLAEPTTMATEPAADDPPAVQPTVNSTPLVEAPSNLGEDPGGAGIPAQGAEIANIDVDVSEALAGRGKAARGSLAARGKLGPESADAVARGLAWLAAHQSRDGGWRFDHGKAGTCRGQCRNAGTHASTTAATALSLLAFLGQGQTHKHGEYQEEVRKGLYYLSGRMVETPHGGDLQEGTMYAQGLATIAFCEAYALTRDEDLQYYALQALKFGVAAQDPLGGGWRYFPGQPGDITVTGWQLMALKCGQMAYLPVPIDSLHGVVNFLDSVAFDSGTHYRYQPEPDPASGAKKNAKKKGKRQPNGLDPTRTAIGLLCRMYTGWGREQAGLQRGVRYLEMEGPSSSDMYYNYYATQVMHHWGGNPWRNWNYRMRDLLLSTQARQGHEAGSWHFPDKHGDQGGRLYNTAMAVMTLEVDYRYLPLYRDEAFDGSH